MSNSKPIIIKYDEIVLNLDNTKYFLLSSNFTHYKLFQRILLIKKDSYTGKLFCIFRNLNGEEFSKIDLLETTYLSSSSHTLYIASINKDKDIIIIFYNVKDAIVNVLFIKEYNELDLSDFIQIIDNNL